MKVLLALWTDSKLNKFSKNFYPLGLLSLATYVKERFPQIEFRVIVGDLEEKDVVEYKPDIVGMSLLSPFFTSGCKIAEQLKVKFPELIIIFGGHHITYLPDNLPPYVDAGVLGEGEKTFMELCKIYLEKKQIAVSDISSLSGIAYWDNTTLKVNKNTCKLLEKENIPVVTNYDICHFKYPAEKTFHIITSRGCPYNCRFCSSTPFWKKVSYYEPSKVLSHIEYIIEKFAPDEISIFDDLVVANKKHLKAISSLVVSKGLNKKVSFSCWVAGSHFDEETVKYLKNMNVTSVSIAVESGSPKIYEYLKGKWCNPQKSELAVEMARKNDLNVDVAVIMGAPSETEDDLRITYQFLRRLPFNFGSVSLLKPFPGSQLWTEAKAMGIVSDHMDDWSEIESDDPCNRTTKFLCREASAECVARYLDMTRGLFKRRAQMSIWRNRFRKAGSIKAIKKFINKKIKFRKPLDA